MHIRNRSKIPEPLLETTFTLLDRVMYSRIIRGLGGLIFPPSSQPKKSEGGRIGMAGERERAISHCHYMRSSTSLYYQTRVSVSAEGCSAKTKESVHTHTLLCKYLHTNLNILTHLNQRTNFHIPLGGGVILDFLSWLKFRRVIIKGIYFMKHHSIRC